jgi:hypothetical protein
MSTADKIRWGRIVIAGILIEVALIVLTIPLFMLAGVEAVVPVIAPLCFIAGFVVCWWLLRRVLSHRILHGFLAGMVATALYLGLILGQYGSLTPVIEMYGGFLFALANGLRILGAVAGGWFAQRSFGDVDRIPMPQ